MCYTKNGETMEKLEEKYIKLLLERCMDINQIKILFIDYDIAMQSFVDKLASYAQEKGIDEVYFNKHDINETNKVLSSIKKEDIKKHPMFNCSVWDEYAKKGAAFLMFASEFPKVMDDVDTEIIAEASKVRLATKPIYKKMQHDDELVWLIAVYPNIVWAKEKFPNLEEKEAYEKLFNLMMEVTMCTTDDPIKSWNEHLKTQKKMIEKINNLKIKTLHYTNKLGTDLTIGLSDKAIWCGAENIEKNYIANMPSYEIFTSPNYNQTEGIVYSAKPLMYNSRLIEDFWVKFKDGKVIDFGAKIGLDLLKEIINGDEGSARLGEVALVDKNSPIAKTNFVFGETCLDENASCHIALGAGFTECIENALDMSKEEKEKIGLNDSKNHVDFMIGTDDLNIEAETSEGTIQIFKNGEFCI